MPKLTSEIALSLVERIEALHEQIAAVYAEARTFDGENNDRVIRDAVDSRKAQREAGDEADALIRSFDWSEDD